MNRPKIMYDEVNDMAYVTYNLRRIAKSIESKDELLVFDVDKHGKLVGVEVMHVNRLINMVGFGKIWQKKHDPELISVSLTPLVFQLAPNF